MTRTPKQATTWRCPLADPEPRIPSIEDIRRLFEQLPADHHPDGGPEALPPPPADRHEETSHECPQIRGTAVAEVRGADRRAVGMHRRDRKSVGSGTRVSVRLDLGGRGFIKKKNK